MLVYSLLLLIALSCCSAEDLLHPPMIHLNNVFLLNQSEAVVTAGSAFILRCRGDSAVRLSSTAFRLQYHDNLPDLLEVTRSVPRHTGTYRCSYSAHNLLHLNTWIHLYVKDPVHTSRVFETPRGVPPVKEGQDFLFKCQLTDPSVTNLTFQSDSRGRSLPQGMNVTFDRWSGVLIRDVQRTFNGRYVCSGLKDGRPVQSAPVDLLVVPRLRLPPSLSVSQKEFVRLEGEKFEVTCLSSNPSHFYNITWTHPLIQTLNMSISRRYINHRMYVNNTASVSAVSHKHSGTFTCTAVNEAGVAMATTQLRVLARPYLIIYMQPLQHANANTRTIFANASSMLEEINTNISMITNVSPNGTDEDVATNANISGNIRVEVNEGRDVTLKFVIEAYPPIRSQAWVTPSDNDNDTMYEESYTANGYRSEASLLLRRVRQGDEGQYSFNFSNSFFSGSQNIDLRIYRSPHAVVSRQNNTLTCSSSGYPPPTVLWLACPGAQDTCGDVPAHRLLPADVTSQEEDVTSQIQLTAGDDVTVECVAYNQLGESRRAVTRRSVAELATTPRPALIGALSAAAALLLLLLVVCYKWKQKPKYEIRWKIIESTDGNNYTFVDPTQLPYNQKWEFPRDKLRLGAVLGSGAFGKVVEATAYGLGTDSNVTRVAVKMLKPSAHAEEREALMSELKILSHLGYHDNIVNLLGACTRGGPMLMITEYCSHGDLLNFLRAHADDFITSILSVNEVEEVVFYKNMAATQNARLRSDSGISCCSEYQEMLPILSPGQMHQGMQTDSVSVGDLIRFSFQVAQGLDFLSNRNCIHRDVAARNVLLTDRGDAKICDFGLARDIRNDDSYIVQGNARLPVKWMAPESIFQCVYTVQSDVWSYGVLLWEIFSLGKSPYPNIAVDTNFYKMIKDGHHMSAPDFAPAEMYQLMTLCWSLEPTHRPTFKTIGQLINRLLPPTSDKAAYRNIDECTEEEELSRGDQEQDQDQIQDQDQDQDQDHDHDHDLDIAQDQDQGPGPGLRH
ncbi:macrophage colony-stimulating factor 1 receptor 2 isoform X2 [Solea solea]|uniref:macrophage colony-stimulating factor 1 receptor 2 isoform X2 n=1 Tax=Solea solea TaxID=90069 RepID=UPI00272B3686|nr:macrophage colony-stimulating factor 1 receptor 2 isoform X2 [Solea solea]